METVEQMTVKTLVIGIGGASSSGKSTIAKILNTIIDNSHLLQQDDFYKKDKEIPVDPKTGLDNWDCPEALNMDAFAKEVNHLRATGYADKTNEGYRYISDTKDQDLSRVSEKTLQKVREILSPLTSDSRTKVILVDGFMLFHDPQIIKLFDLPIFITCSYDTLKQRRESRAGYQTQESFWVDPPGYFDQLVYPAYVDSHGYLFEDIDKGILRQDKVKELNIFPVKNDDETSFDDTVLQVVTALRDLYNRTK